MSDLLWSATFLAVAGWCLDQGWGWVAVVLGMLAGVQVARLASVAGPAVMTALWG